MCLLVTLLLSEMNILDRFMDESDDILCICIQWLHTDGFKGLGSENTCLNGTMLCLCYLFNNILYHKTLFSFFLPLIHC